MDAENERLNKVLDKLRAAWYPQLDADENEIELTDVNQRNVSLETPLIVAAQHLGPEEIQILVEFGADINAQSGSEQQDSALHVARLMGKFENAEKLISLGANIALRNAIGKTPMDYGLRTQNLK